MKNYSYRDRTERFPALQTMQSLLLFQLCQNSNLQLKSRVKTINQRKPNMAKFCYICFRNFLSAKPTKLSVLKCATNGQRVIIIFSTFTFKKLKKFIRDFASTENSVGAVDFLILIQLLSFSLTEIRRCDENGNYRRKQLH